MEVDSLSTVTVERPAAWVWPLDRLHEAAQRLIQLQGYRRDDATLAPLPPHLLAAGETAALTWFSNALMPLGLEAEAIQWTYNDTEKLLHSAGPALLHLPQHAQGSPQFLALLPSKRKKVRLIGSDLKQHYVAVEQVHRLLWASAADQFTPFLTDLMHKVNVAPQRKEAMRRLMLENLADDMQGSGCWMIRLSPGADSWRQILHGGLLKPLAVILGAHIVQVILSLVGWWLIGRGALQGHYEPLWLWGWALVTITAVPFQVSTNWESGVFAIRMGSLFKRRLLLGALRLNPEETKHEGVGQFLSRIMESEAAEGLFLGSGFATLMGGINLLFAMAVLWMGAGGPLHALLLGGWLLLTILLTWRLVIRQQGWVDVYKEMTNDLVERMVGQRTRLAQEQLRFWHVEEDEIIGRYFHWSKALDRSQLQLGTIISRGWLLVGLSGVAYAFLFTPNDTEAIAISVGGVIWASQALSSMVGGIMSVSSLIIGWREVKPLFTAATRMENVSMAAINVDGIQAPMDTADRARELMVARRLHFHYPGRPQPILEGCDFKIYEGDRLLLEGPSGGGKSTLASILVGLRAQTSGLLLLHGFDRATLGDALWRERVIAAPQFHENHVLTETFSFNLLMGRNWPPSPEDLEEATQICHELGLGDLLETMPAGFQQMVGESGWQLSHGERSRLFIARALLQKADMIILDESFAALDPENLALALQCVRKRARTLLVIAHP